MSEVDISKISNKNHLTKIEENILAYIIKNIDNVKEIGVRGIAKEHYTSTTTIMNLSKKLGYAGFLDMYYNLYFTLKNKKNYHNRELPSKYFGANMDEILSLIDNYNIEEFVDILIKNRNETIYTCGLGFSQFIAQYITRKLLVIGFNCIFSEAYDSYDVNSIRAKLFINISKSGETDFLIHACESAKKNNIKIISFTGESENTLAKLSDVNFRIYDMHSIDDRNKLPNSFYANVMMLFEFLLDKYLERIND